MKNEAAENSNCVMHAWAFNQSQSSGPHHSTTEDKGLAERSRRSVPEGIHTLVFSGRWLKGNRPSLQSRAERFEKIFHRARLNTPPAEVKTVQGAHTWMAKKRSLRNPRVRFTEQQGISTLSPFPINTISAPTSTFVCY